ncbi:fusaridione A cluster transcription factor fsdR [Apiospora rasikravindrae]|uniref:Fusaridione A cluster transcription factor fsdR n=1 Tax=Apiospora rasikravindrae TaxID=990691 RepID=A0ABR1TDL8_9PEZI
MDTAAPYPFAEDKSQQCLRHCERLLSELVTRDEDTLGIQALLALVVLHLAAGDEKSASMLISAAMRLAHSLQMHTRTFDMPFPLREAEQRHSIFWICYCLDKDISLRTSTPSVQLDSDIDLNVPGTTASSVSPENMFGIAEENDDDEGGQPPSFHHLRARVQLAFIGGQIYDSLYSVRSLKATPEKRKQQVVRLDALLDTWRRSSLLPVPKEDQSVTYDTANRTASLNHTYLFCLFSIHGLYSWDSIWVQNIDALGRTALEDFSNKSEKCMHSLQPPIPAAWNKCVLASRCSVQLIMRDQDRHPASGHTKSNRHNNSSLWFSTCLLFSALVILLVNITYEPGHERASQDRQLAAAGAAFLKGVLVEKGDTASTGLISVLRGLELAADKWTGYHALDPLSVRPPLPAKGHDLFGNGILMMALASPSSSDSLNYGASLTESLIDASMSFDDPIASWTEKRGLDTSSIHL